MPSPPSSVSADQVRAELARVLESRAFAHSERLRRFLAFTTGRVLDGRADEIKEYVLAVEVFDRAGSYDPNADALVRVEARRLRLKLEQYYAAEGASDPISIEVPKGSYVPVFQWRPGHRERTPEGGGLEGAADGARRPDGGAWRQRVAAGLVAVVAVTGASAAVYLRTGRAAADPAPAHAVAPAAREALVRGRYLRSQLTPESVAASVRLFEEAVRADAGFAEAHAALADALAALAFHGLVPVSASVERARASAERALALDPSLAEAHGVLGWIRFFADWDWPGAERALTRALELDPSNARLRQRYAFGLVTRRRFDEAIDQSRRATELDPQSFYASNDYATILYYSGRYAEARRQAERTLEMKPALPVAHVLIGMCELAEGRPAEAVASLERGLGEWRELSGARGRLAFAYAQAGRRAEALAIVEQLERLRPEQGAAAGETGGGPDGEPGFEVALARMGLGDRPRALGALERAAARGESELLFLDVTPAFGGLAGDPRFEAVRARIGLGR